MKTVISVVIIPAIILFGVYSFVIYGVRETQNVIAVEQQKIDNIFADVN